MKNQVPILETRTRLGNFSCCQEENKYSGLLNILVYIDLLYAYRNRPEEADVDDENYRGYSAAAYNNHLVIIFIFFYFVLFKIFLKFARII